MIAYYTWGSGSDPGNSDGKPYAQPSTSPTAGDDKYILPNGGTLKNGQRYYSSVRAYDNYGLYIELMSNGVTIDVTRPLSGIVMDGLHLHDYDSSSDTEFVRASWHGYADFESGIQRYEVALSTSASTGLTSSLIDGLLFQYRVPTDSNAQFVSVGLHLSAILRVTTTWPSLQLLQGQRFYVFVRAVNGAGLPGDAIPSDGFTVDTTAPVPAACVTNNVNILADGSFETFGVSNASSVVAFNTPGFISSVTSSPWVQTVGVGRRWLVNATSLDSPDYTGYIYELSVNFDVGEIMQSFSTTVGAWYRVSFSAAGFPNGVIQGQAGRVVAAELDRIFTMAEGHVDGSWRTFTFEFVATNNVTQLSISALGNGINRGMALENVQVQMCTNVNVQAAIPTSITLPTGRQFAAIDMRNPDTVGLSCQLGAVALPAGWIIAEDDSTTRQIISEHRWGAACVVLATGLAYSSAARGGLAGSLCSACSGDGNSLNCLQNGVSSFSFGVDCTQYSMVVLIEKVPAIYLGKPYQNAESHIQAWWNMIDPESGVKDYQWAIGTVPGGTQLRPFTPTGTLASGDAYDLLLHHNMRVYVTVLGQNWAGLTAKMVSNPLIIDWTPPILTSPVLDLNGINIGVDSDLTESLSLSASWFGFVDPESGLQWCRLGFGHEPGMNDVYPLTLMISAGEVAMQGTLSGVVLVHGETYYADVHCANNADLGMEMKSRLALEVLEFR